MSKNKKNSRRRKSKVIGSILILAIVVFAAQAYLLSPQKVFGRGILKYLPLPAAFVNSDAVLLGQYYDRVDIAAKLNQGNLRGVVLQQMIDNKIAELTAKNKGVTVGNSDIDQAYADLQKISGEKQLGAAYGISEADFKRELLTPDVIKTKLQIWLASNKKLNSTQYAKLDQVNQALANKESFNSVAEKYSEDSKSVQIGGDLGFISYADIVPEIYDKLADIKDRNAHVLVSRFGIHVIQVVDHDANGPQGSIRYHLKQIFIKTTDYQRWFNQQKNYFSVLRLAH